jgi:DNA-binding transcriptional ArsR family regulator
MEDSELLLEKNGKLFRLKAKTLDTRAIKALSNSTRMKILKMLSKKQMYSGEIASKLRIDNQKAHYHIKELLKSGLIAKSEIKEVKGTFAKLYRLNAHNLFYSFKEEIAPYKDYKDKNLLNPFIEEGMLKAKIIVGSPDPHGPYKVRARDGHYATALALYLGKNSLFEGFPIVLDIDWDIKRNEHIILIGGPISNIITNKVNKGLKKHFLTGKIRGIKGNKIYTEDNIGLIAKANNPYNNSQVLLFAGNSAIGTKAAIMAFIDEKKMVAERISREFYMIVQGFDLDGDGKIDNIELLE